MVDNNERPRREERNRGGLFTGHFWCFPRETPKEVKRAYTIVFGNVITDAHVRTHETKHGISRHVYAYVKYNTKCYIEIRAIGSGRAAEILADVKKDDVVFIAGRRTERKYNTEKNGEVWGYFINACIVIPLHGLALLNELWHVHEKIPIGLPRFLLALYRDPRTRERVEIMDRINQDCDVWESD